MSYQVKTEGFHNKEDAQMVAQTIREELPFSLVLKVEPDQPAEATHGAP